MSKRIDAMVAAEPRRRAAAASEAVALGMTFRVVQRWERGVDSAPAYFSTLAAAERAIERSIKANTARKTGTPENELTLDETIERFAAGAWLAVEGSSRWCVYRYLYATEGERMAAEELVHAVDTARTRRETEGQ